MDRWTETSKSTIRIIYVCRKCKAARRLDYTRRVEWLRFPSPPYRVKNAVQCQTTAGKAADELALQAQYAVCACGGYTEARAVKGVLNPGHKCDSRCLNAKTGDCECACGGENHGRGYVAA